MNNEKLESEFLRQNRILFYSNTIVGVMFALAACATMFWHLPEMDGSLLEFLPRILQRLVGAGAFAGPSAYFLRSARMSQVDIVELLKQRRAHVLERQNGELFKQSKALALSRGAGTANTKRIG